MFRLTALLYAVIGTTLAGIAMITMLTLGLDTTRPIVLAVVAGFLLGLPVSWLIAKKVQEL